MNQDLNYIFELPGWSRKHFGLEDQMAQKVNGVWRKYSSAEVDEISTKMAYGFAALGLKAGDKIAIAAANSPQWQFFNLGAAKLGLINVPLYANITAKDYAFILNDCGAKLMMVENKDLYDKIESVQEDLPELKHLFSIDELDCCRNWKEILKFGRESPQPALVEKNQAAIKPDDLYTIIYTSGTTGKPKGVQLSHNNLISQLHAVAQILPIGQDDSSLSFLPLCHSFERTIEYFYLFRGVSIYYAESMDTIGDNLKEVKPTIMPTVPRLLEKVYDKIMAKGDELEGIKRKLFFWAVDLGLEYELTGKSLGYKIKLAIANMLIFKKWRQALGGNMRMIVSGAAALQPRLARIFTAGKIPILEGYGLSETSPVISVNHFDPNGRCFGSVGCVIDKVTVKIAEDGEILCKGPNVMLGYYNRPEETAKVMDKDGWFHTGDIGEMVDGKFLKITDRKKEIFKTSGGKYIAPQVLENSFKESELIDQIMIVGEGEKMVAAFISPNFEALHKWCKENNVNLKPNESLVKEDKVIAIFQSEIDQLNTRFAQFEQVKKICVLPNEWSVEGGELTPTLKLKRRVIMDKVADQYKELYS